MEEYSLEDQMLNLEFNSSNTNSTLMASCVASSLQANHSSSFPPDVDIALRYIQVLIVFLRTLFGIILNVLVIFLVAKFKKLRNLSFGIAMQISVADLVLTSNYFLYGINLLADRWIMGISLCVLSGFIMFSFAYLRNALILAFALDRLASVFSPFDYPKYRRKVMVVLCISFWCLSFFKAVILIPPFFYCYKLHSNTEFCSYSSTCSRNCKILHYIFAITHHLPSFIIPPAIFVTLYIKGRIISRQLNNELGRRALMTEEDWRALKTFSLLVTFVIIYSVAIIGYQVIVSLFPNFNSAGALFAVLYSLLVVVDPLIILKNADVREVIKSLWTKIKKSHDPLSKMIFHPTQIDS